MNKEIFKKLSETFLKNGHKIYMIGGTSRDYLLGLDVLDFDFCTDATPDEIKSFYPDADFTFAKYGSIHIEIDGVKTDITTLRKEEGYGDFRHPSKIVFVKSIDEDYKRRDFTINAIYIDENYKVRDPSNGLDDLKNKIIRFIGNPEERIKEDPLRILRAERFASKLGFEIEKNSKDAIEKYRFLLDKLNPEKVRMELTKNK